MDWCSQDLSEVFNTFDSQPARGLENSQIPQLQNKFGKNVVGKEEKFKAIKVFVTQFKNPLIYLLLTAALVSFVLNEIKDVFVIMVVVLANSILGFFQEFRADKSLRELNRLLKIQIRVLRSGEEVLISSEDLVPGDIFFLSAGDVCAADGRIIEAYQAKVNEAVLSGESLPVEKNSNHSMIFSGTILLTGRVKAIVVATGEKSEMGKIAGLTKKVKDPLTPLEFKIKKFSRFLLIFSFFIFLLILFVGFVKNLPFKELLLIAISQVVSIVPEGLPVAMTIAAALGIRRMAAKNAIIRKLSSVETLGSTTIICSDKTGTITENKMTVTEVVDQNLKAISVGEIFKIGTLCNDGVLNHEGEIGDPTETAILRKAFEVGFDKKKLDLEFKRIGEIPFSSENKFMMTEHLGLDGKSFVALKGAVLQILEFSKLDELEKKRILEFSSEMSSRGLRVLAFGILPEHHLARGYGALYGKFQFLGLMGEIDPPRIGVSNAIQECREAGIKTMMITGDHNLTATSIGKMIGLFHDGDIALDADEISKKEIDFNKVKIISRVRPEQKLEIVSKLQSKGHVVAMTGDGVNDAPALAKADVGIAMGITGTEVTKQASKIILADDKFTTILEAIKEGRLVYKNIKKIILLLFSTSLSELIILVLALLMGFPAPFLAVQILWNNLVTEGVITVNLIMDPLEGTEMKDSPLKKDAPLISKMMWQRMMLIVPTMVITTLGWFIFRIKSGVGVELARTETMTLLVLCEWFNVLNCRSEIKSAFSFDIFKNRWLLVGLFLGNLLHLLVVFWRPLGDYFNTQAIDLSLIPLLAFLASFVLIVEEIRKLTARKFIFK